MKRTLSTLTLFIALVTTACGGFGEPWGSMGLPFIADGDFTNAEPDHLAVKIVTAESPAAVCHAMVTALGRHGFESRDGKPYEFTKLGDVKLKRGTENWDLNCSDVNPAVPSEGMFVVVMRAEGLKG